MRSRGGDTWWCPGDADGRYRSGVGGGVERGHVVGPRGRPAPAQPPDERGDGRFLAPDHADAPGIFSHATTRTHDINEVAFDDLPPLEAAEPNDEAEGEPEGEPEGELGRTAEFAPIVWFDETWADAITPRVFRIERSWGAAKRSIKTK